MTEEPKAPTMERGVIYLVTGPAHAVRAVVSLRSLRRHFDGPITFYTTQPESAEVAARCAADARLQVQHLETNQVISPKNSSFLTKLELLTQTPFDVTLYLDADTLVVGPIDDLFAAAENQEFAATQFAHWVSSGKTIRRRIEAWRDLPQERIPAQELNKLVEEALVTRPAVNGGVFAFRRDSPLLAPWRELAYAGWQTFICDEIALQLLLPRYEHSVLDCRFNCSPVFAHRQADVRIWHFHGERHVKNERCRELWWPNYRSCVLDNIGGLADWSPGADPQLARFLKGKRV